MPKSIVVRICGREEAISCEEHEVEDLIRAASLLDTEMNRTSKLVRKTISFDRLCLLASLNLINRLLQAEAKIDELSTQLNSLLELRQRLGAVLESSAMAKNSSRPEKLL
ncbi:MAG: cell division protein ZapA [Gammaproteobacteria bacterium]|nr:cell division protein ZapA [Pseudomonadota bacterium]MCH9662579.1 cell division protein ZapA [Gammaproteobacteria bacterium]